MQLWSAVQKRWGIWAAGAIGTVAYGGFVVLDATEGTLRSDVTPRTIGLYLLAFAGFVLAVWWQEHRGISWVWLLAIPLCFRLMLVFTTPTLSDDVYRYLWDGHLITEGANPYSHTIDDPQRDQYEIEARTLANSPNYATPYLPTAQFVFGVTALVAPSEPTSMQLVMVAFDVGVALVLIRLLALTGLPRGRLVLYWWNPLVIVEVSHGAHLDSLMIALALLAVFLSLRESSPKWSGPVVLALATLTRPLPLLLLPVLWWRWTWPQRALYGLVSFTLILPFGIWGGWGLFGDPVRTGVFGSIRVFVREVSFNSGIYHWSEGWFERRGAADAASSARTLMAVLLVAMLVYVWHRCRHGSALELMRAAALVFMGYVVLASILHPWYVVTLMAFLPFVTPTADEDNRRWWLLVPWLYLAGALILSYLTYLDPLQIGELEWVRRTEWYPTLALLPLTAWLGLRRDRTSS